MPFAIISQTQAAAVPEPEMSDASDDEGSIQLFAPSKRPAPGFVLSSC